MVTLTDKVRRLFDGRNFAVVSTLDPDGTPHSTVVWAQRDGDDIVFAQPKGRRKTANLNRAPRATVVTSMPPTRMTAPRYSWHCVHRGGPERHAGG